MLELINAKSNKKNTMEDQKQSSYAPTNPPTVRFCFVQINEIFFFPPLNGVGTHNLLMIFQLQTVNERLEIYLIYIDKDGNAEE